MAPRTPNSGLWCLLFSFLVHFGSGALAASAVVQKRQAPNNGLVQQWLNSYWIWTSDGVGQHAPGGDRAFRTTYTPSSGVSVVGMNVLATADDYFTLYLNGQVICDTRWQVGTGVTVWASAQGATVSLNTNVPLVFAVLGTNNPSNGGAPAGILVAIQLSLSDGSTAFVTTGGSSWVASETVPTNFQSTDTSVSGWASASVLSKNGAADPWGVVQLPSTLTAVSVSLPQTSAATTPNTTPASSPTKVQNPTTPNPDPSVGTTAPTTVQTTVIITTEKTAGGGATTDGGQTTGANTLGPPGATATVVATIPPASSAGSDTEGGTHTTVGSGNGAVQSNVVAASSSSKPSTGAIAGGAVGGVIVLILLILGVLWCYRGRKRRGDAAKLVPFTATGTSNATEYEIFPQTTPSRNRALVPFMLQTPRNDGLRSKAPYGHDAKAVEAYGVGATESPGAGSSTMDDVELGRTAASNQGALADELQTTMQRLRQLTDELNRGLVEQGANNPQAAALRSRITQLMRAESVSGSSDIYHDRHTNIGTPPPYEGRPETS
ncbi:hypothetical protein H0H81_006522 [Sphagnurus paluster]|uniref:Uncharacterized protein n=1 Tax=Sphagnurus paluster TaxID=117069 RepID=A0A9P7KGY5_9AGAR|nr:hypothetical protein H0H81_006522 [Sphagnurus paluster]